MIDIGAICHLIRARQVPALSIRQPWAHRIIYRGKDIENRSWETSYRGWIMVHAGLALDRPAVSDYLCDPRDRNAEYPRGGIVGMVRIDGATRADPSPWFFGPVGLILRHPISLPLIECKGRLGFFKPEPEIGEAVIAALIAKARK
jgi:hypothetical protein